jgi:sugar O-acyltransferase (sialic acid O-acetyltransferase NeuD family)
MSKPGIVLIGSGGHARSCIDVIEQSGQYQIAGLIGIEEQIHPNQLAYPVIGCDNDLDELAKSYQYALVAIGHIETAKHRLRIYNRALQCGFQLPVIIAPTAYVSRHAKIGSGTIVMQGAIVNAGAEVGVNCIINSRALIEHDTRVADHCHISTGAILNGDVSIGARSFVGSGCFIKEGISVGKGCLIGMGLTVRHALADNTRYTGRYRA